MSYSVVKNEQGTYDLLEKESDTMIELHKDEEEIRSICRKLNLGSGFNGWTPNFVAARLDK